MILIIGDPHFSVKHFLEGEELIKKTIEIVKSSKPLATIILGDVLDTHEVAKNAPFKQAVRFIEALSEYAPLYVLIGNHDLINQKQYLTDNHFFGPLKKWNNVTIVDTPIKVDIGKNVVMCPYVPCGRLEEALDVLVDLEYDWRYDSVCVFAHQEIKGVVYGGKTSEIGDIWDPSYPPLISGHIHNSCTVGTNVYYPGSSRQVSIDEDPNKKLWLISFNDNLKIKKIDLNLKGKKEIEIPIEEIENFDFKLKDKYYVKLKIKGTSEQFKVFRKSKLHSKMIKEGILIGFDPIKINAPLFERKSHGDKLTFDQIVENLVNDRSENIQLAYKDLKKRSIEIVFIED